MAKVKMLDLAPSPTAYRTMLRAIIQSSPKKADVAWAKKELKRVARVKKWGPRDK